MTKGVNIDEAHGALSDTPHAIMSEEGGPLILFTGESPKRQNRKLVKGNLLVNQTIWLGRRSLEKDGSYFQRPTPLITSLKRQLHSLQAGQQGRASLRCLTVLKINSNDFKELS